MGEHEVCSLFVLLDPTEPEGPEIYVCQCDIAFSRSVLRLAFLPTLKLINSLVTIASPFDFD